MKNKRQKIEIADIFKRFKSQYNEQYEMIHEKRKAFSGFDSAMLEWRPSDEDFFAPVKVLSSLFRGIFAQNIYKLADELIPDKDGKKADVDFLRKLIYKTRWNVFAKPALKNAENVIEYLGPYTHRVAISNARILEIAGNKVHFVWKDYKQNGRTKVMKLEAVEFISRKKE